MTNENPTTSPVAKGDLASVKAVYSALQVAIQSFDEPGLEDLTIHLRLPSTDSAAMAFSVGVSWTYVALWETGKVTFRFLIERARAFGMDSRFELDAFRTTTHALRTLLQHGLNPAESKDAAKLATASQWMATACGVDEQPGTYFWPEHDVEWELLAASFYTQAEAFLGVCLQAVHHIQNDEARAATIQEWARRCSDVIPGHVFDIIIAEAVQRLGLPFLNLTVVRNIYLAQWNERLRVLDHAADFKRVARNLVEQSLIQEWQRYCPLNGDDLMMEFQLAPSLELRKLIQRAGQLWRESPCERDELLQRLKDETTR